MLIRLYANGGDFKERPSLTSAVSLLYRLDKTVTYCAERSFVKYSSNDFRLNQPRILLQDLKQSSLDASIIYDIPQIAALIAPVINAYGWELFSSTFEYIRMAVEFFNAKGSVLNASIDDSPNANNLIFQNNGDVIINQSVFDSAKRLHKDITGLADGIGPNGPNTVIIQYLDDASKEVIDSFEINKDNATSYKVIDIEKKEEDPIEVQCQVYKLNKRTRNGGIEISDEEGNTKKINISVEEDIVHLSDFIHAMSCNSSFVKGKPEYKINALGEKSLSHITVTSIVNIK